MVFILVILRYFLDIKYDHLTFRSTIDISEDLNKKQRLDIEEEALYNADFFSIHNL